MSKRILCIWHVEKNVLSYAARFFKEGDIDKRDQFMVLWAAILGSRSRIEYEENWEVLAIEYEVEYSELLQYLKEMWLVFKWNLIPFWVDQNLHLGNRATS
jgi:hypothetical protein